VVKALIFNRSSFIVLLFFAETFQADFRESQLLPADPALDLSLRRTADATLKAFPKLTADNLAMVLVDVTKPDVMSRADYRGDAPIRDSAGTQFYLTLSPQYHLTRAFTVFGEIESGFDVLGRLAPNSVARIPAAFYAISCLGLFVFVFQPPLWVLEIGAIFVASGAGLSGPGLGSVYSQVIPPSVRTQGLQVFNLATLPAYLLFPLVGFFVSQWGYTPALLTALGSHPGARLGLVTGNYEAVARVKLRQAGIGRPFNRCPGGFGSDSEDRAALPGIARRLAGDAARPWPREQTVVIGDTPRDIACARADGLRCVAVTTGPHDAAALAGADWVAESADELEAVLRREVLGSG